MYQARGAELAGHATIEQHGLGVVVGADDGQVAHQRQEALQVEAVDVDQVERTGSELPTKRRSKGALSWT